MEFTLEAIALFALKLVHETDDGSPLLRDDPVMAAYVAEVFGLLLRQGELEAIQLKLDECIDQALQAVGGTGTALGRELQRLSGEVQSVSRLEDLREHLIVLMDYLKDIQ